MQSSLTTTLHTARQASYSALTIPTEQKNTALSTLITLLETAKEDIFSANKKDIQAAQEAGKDTAFIDRLTFTEGRFSSMIQGIQTVITLPDPVGEIYDTRTVPNGLIVKKMRVPIGVILIIYEARPNVTIDVASLAIKSGNVCLAKGGTLSQHANLLLASIVQDALSRSSIDPAFFQYLHLPNHADLTEVLHAEKYIDLVIPRGSSSLVRSVTEQSTIPVIKHDEGIAHMYIDKDANLDIAWKTCLNAKINRPATCNAVDALLVHEDIAEKFLPRMIADYRNNNVEVRGDSTVQKIDPTVIPTTDNDWGFEYLDYILAIKVVKNIQEAIEHSNRYSSKHTEAIISDNKAAQDVFIKTVDAGVVLVNASTRLNDGFEFGLGAELGISTGKLHARGPMGLQEMTTYKWIGIGNGTVRS